MELEVKSEAQEGVGTVAVRGEVDVSNAGKVREAVDALLARDDVSSVIVDLRDVPYIDSTGIGVLVGGLSHAQEEGKTLRAINATPSVARIIGMLGVDEILSSDK